jgi:hypothetical protein
VNEVGTWKFTPRKQRTPLFNFPFVCPELLTRSNNVVRCWLSCELNVVQEISQGGRQDIKSKGRTLSEQPIR